MFLLLAQRVPKLRLWRFRFLRLFNQPERVEKSITSQCTTLPVQTSKALAKIVVKEEYAKVHGVHAIDATTPGKALGLKIMNVSARPGGRYSGSKALSIRVDLYQDGAVVASKLFSQHGVGGVLGPFQNCNILAVYTDAIASDVFDWLKSTQHPKKLPAVLKRIDPSKTGGTGEDDVNATADPGA